MSGFATMVVPPMVANIRSIGARRGGGGAWRHAIMMGQHSPRRRVACAKHKRNGGRHCCQPPLRRAKDLPVFDQPWFPLRKTGLLTPLLDPGSPAQASLSIRTAPSCEEPDRSTRLRGPKVRWSFDLSGPASGTEVPRQPKPSDVPRPFLGQPLLRPASLTRSHEEIREPRRARGRSPLPAPLPGWPEIEPEGSSHCLPAEIGPLVTCRFLSCRCRLLREAGTAVPITCSPCTSRSESRKQKMRGSSLWITGISGTTVGTFSDSSNRPRFGCRFVPLRLPRPSA